MCFEGEVEDDDVGEHSHTSGVAATVKWWKAVSRSPDVGNAASDIHATGLDKLTVGG